MSNTERNTTSAEAQVRSYQATVCPRCLELTTRLVAVEHELYEAQKREQEATVRFMHAELMLSQERVRKRVPKRPVRCEEPLPCPFCGGLAISEAYIADGETHAVCNDCGATGPDSGHDDAIANWDRRTPDNA